jgi:adenylate cyclase
MEAARRWFNFIWRNPLGTVLLYGSLLIHFALALQALYRRHTLRMPFREAAQLALGLSLPFLLVSHVVGTRIELAITGHEVGYPDVLRGLWALNPLNGAKQALALVIAWLHGCLGVYFWLRPKPGFQPYALALYTAALLVPVLALLGFAEAGRDIASLPERALETSAVPSSTDLLSQIRYGLYTAFGGLVAGILALRGLRLFRTWSTRSRTVSASLRRAASPVFRINQSAAAAAAARPAAW